MKVQPTFEWQPTIVYVINSFDRGGAEAGLVAMVQGGLFRGCRLLIVGLVRGAAGVESKLAALSHVPRILADRSRMRVVDMPRLYFRLRRLLKSERPDIVIASLPQANILSRLCLYFQRRTTFISFEHNTYLAKRAYEFAYRLTSSRVDWIFADAATTLNVAAKRLYRSTPQRQTIVPLLCFPEARRISHSKDPTTFHIVNAARFTVTKNQAALIHAVAILLIRRGRKVTLTLYGEGPEKHSCMILAARLGINEEVNFPGFVTNWASLRSDLFVLVSRNEGLCMAVLEAMHAGIPVMARIVGGMIDYADSSVLRELSTLEPEVIANEIAKQMDDVEALNALARRAHDMVYSRFGVGYVQQAYRQINALLKDDIKLRANPLIV